MFIYAFLCMMRYRPLLLDNVVYGTYTPLLYLSITPVPYLPPLFTISGKIRSGT